MRRPKDTDIIAYMMRPWWVSLQQKNRPAKICGAVDYL